MSDKTITIEGSGRHIHVSKADLETLFGAGFELEVKKYLSQPGEFASNSKVDVVGPKGTLKNISILGPCRGATQVELSFTDARAAGLVCPIRQSGDLAGSAPCTLVGPAGQVDLSEGTVIAKRHIHFTPEDAERFGVKNNQIVKVKTAGERAIIFDEVVARVSPTYATYMHIDYDELNAAALFENPVGEVIL